MEHAAWSSRARRSLARGGVVLAIGLLAMVVGCAPVVRRGSSELRAGVTPTYPPLAFEENGRIAGMEADFARRLSAELGRTITFVTLPLSELIPALSAGRIDLIMSGLSITAERAQLVSFTRPYLRVGQMALIRRTDYPRLRDASAMDQPTARVGFQSASTGEAFARAELERADLRGFESADDGIAALRAGRIDFFVHDAPTIWRVTGGLERSDPALKGLYRPLTEEHLAWAVRKSDAKLRDQLDTALLRWQTTGVLDDIVDDWITVRKVTVEVMPAR
jgi:polar amino acid transport system substrate-binding protein